MDTSTLPCASGMRAPSPLLVQFVPNWQRVETLCNWLALFALLSLGIVWGH